MHYVFDESLGRGTVYLSDDHQAAALWNFEKKERLSFQFISRNWSFLWKMGLKTTFRVLKTDKLIYHEYPKHKKYCQLYLFGVLP